jgi:hypothetical protein
MSKWSQEDILHGVQEGWILTNDSAERFIIARVDDPPAWNEDGCPIDYEEPKFESDEDAEAHVTARAEAGDEVAIKALSHVSKRVPWGWNL